MGILALNNIDFKRILLLDQNTLSNRVMLIKIVTRSTTKRILANLFYSVRLRSLLKLLMLLA